MAENHIFKKPEHADTFHRLLADMLAAQADEKTAKWFTDYLKGVITYRGLKTPMLKGILTDFFNATAADELPDETQLAHIRHWLGKPMAEDKLTALLWLENWVKKQLKEPDREALIAQALSMLEDAFQSGDIHDWSTNDWCCVRVLELIPQKAPRFVPRLMSWAKAETIWQRRSGILAFKKSAKSGAYHTEIETLINTLLPSDERFVQTAIGWVLADASRKYPDWAAQQFDIYFDQLSHEVIVRHAKYLPDYDQAKQRSRERRR